MNGSEVVRARRWGQRWGKDYHSARWVADRLLEGLERPPGIVAGSKDDPATWRRDLLVARPGGDLRVSLAVGEWPELPARGGPLWWLELRVQAPDFRRNPTGLVVSCRRLVELVFGDARPWYRRADPLEPVWCWRWPARATQQAWGPAPGRFDAVRAAVAVSLWDAGFREFSERAFSPREVVNGAR